jgi:hypothetical protein
LGRFAPFQAFLEVADRRIGGGGLQDDVAQGEQGFPLRRPEAAEGGVVWRACSAG